MVSTQDLLNCMPSSVRKVVLIDGCRTPFLKSGTGYMDLMSYQLAHYAIKGLLVKTSVSGDVIDNVILGNVVSNVKTPNVAREAALAAEIPSSVPARTVSQACISANRAICDGILEIMAGRAEAVVAGGVDCVSDAPIQFRKAMRRKLFKAQKLKAPLDYVRFLFSLRPADFFPERPEVAEYSTKRVMGQDCDIMAARFQVTREEQDEFAVRSHHLAHKAYEEGLLANEMVEVSLPPEFTPIVRDNGIRGDTGMEKIRRLRPVFDRKFGTLTAANSSFLTDGAAAVLIMTEEKALGLGLSPKAEVIDFAFTGQDVTDELLLGPAYAISQLLRSHNMGLGDFDVLELHEAFAGQVLANIKAMASADFAARFLGGQEAVGLVNMDLLNLWGGSLSIGHPFGATGARIMTTAANRLAHENGQYALLASCAAGAHGHAMILKRYG